MKCPKCNLESEKYTCPQCGTQLACTQCDEPIKKGDTVYAGGLCEECHQESEWESEDDPNDNF